MQSKRFVVGRWTTARLVPQISIFFFLSLFFFFDGFRKMANENHFILLLLLCCVVTYIGLRTTSRRPFDALFMIQAPCFTEPSLHLKHDEHIPCHESVIPQVCLRYYESS